MLSKENVEIVNITESISKIENLFPSLLGSQSNIKIEFKGIIKDALSHLVTSRKKLIQASRLMKLNDEVKIYSVKDLDENVKVSPITISQLIKLDRNGVLNEI